MFPMKTTLLAFSLAMVAFRMSVAAGCSSDLRSNDDASILGTVKIWLPAVAEDFLRMRPGVMVL